MAVKLNIEEIRKQKGCMHKEEITQMSEEMHC